jgi:hypothetical protein
MWSALTARWHDRSSDLKKPSNRLGSTPRCESTATSSHHVRCSVGTISRPNRQVGDRLHVVRRRKGSLLFCGAKCRTWPIPTDRILTTDRRFRGTADARECRTLTASVARDPERHFAPANYRIARDSSTLVLAISRKLSQSRIGPQSARPAIVPR